MHQHQGQLIGSNAQMRCAPHLTLKGHLHLVRFVMVTMRYGTGIVDYSVPRRPETFDNFQCCVNKGISKTRHTFPPMTDN